MLHGKIIGIIFLLIPIILLSTHAVSMRYIIETYSMSPMLISFYRFFLGAIFLLVIYALSTHSVKKFKSDLLDIKGVLKDKIVWVVIFSLLFNFITFHYGLKYTFASNTILIESLFPILVFFQGLFFYKQYLHSKREHLRKIFMVLAVAGVGVGLLVVNDNPNVGGGDLKIFGDFLAFLSMILIAIFSVFNYVLRKKYNLINGILLTGVVFGICALGSLPFVFSSIFDIFTYNSEQALIVLYLGFFCSGLAYVFWFYLPRYLNHITISIFINLIGVTTLLFEYLIFRESAVLSINMLLGGMLIVGSGIYIEYLNSKGTKKIVPSDKA